jgi:hypothetical protein
MHLLAQDAKPANPRADNRANTVAVVIVDRQPGMSHRLQRRRQGILGEAIHATRFATAKQRRAVKTLHFCREARLELGGIKMSYRPRTRPARQKSAPCSFNIIAKRAYGS